MDDGVIEGLENKITDNAANIQRLDTETQTLNDVKANKN